MEEPMEFDDSLLATKNAGESSSNDQPQQKDADCNRQTQEKTACNRRRSAKQGWTPYLVFCNVVIISGSSFMFGYNAAVVNGPYQSMNRFLNATLRNNGISLSQEDLSSLWSFAVSVYLIGCLIGSTGLPGALTSRYGRRDSLIIASIIGIVGETLLFISPVVESLIPFLLGRFIAGLQGGVSMVLAPGLVAETAPLRLRGICGTLFTIGIPVGLIVANFLGLNFILGSDDTWQFLFLIVALFYGIHGASLFYVVESPRWLLTKNRPNRAFTALAKLRKEEELLVREEFNELELAVKQDSLAKSVSFSLIIRDRRYWWPLVLTVNLHIINRMAGVVVVFSYTVMVLTSAGFDSVTASLANLGVTFALIFGTIMCTFVLGRFGRRKLMLAGTLGMVITHIFITIFLWQNLHFATVAAFAVFLFVFTIGPGPIPWFMPLELVPQAARPFSLGVCMFSNMAGNLFSSFAFPLLQLHLGYLSFLPFAAVSFCGFLFLFFFLPETDIKIAKYSPDMFEPGRSLLQYRQAEVRKNNVAEAIVNREEPVA